MSEVSIGALWRGWRDELAAAGIATAALDAKLLTGHALGLTSLELSTNENGPVTPLLSHAVDALMQRRLKGESVARIIGEREFYGLPFRLNQATLEPRPDTELLVDLALKALPQGGRLLDLGTGTGCIPISILANRGDATGMATDLEPEALEMARWNAQRHGVGGRLAFAQGSWFEALNQLLPPRGGGWEGGSHEHGASSPPHPRPPRKGKGAPEKFDLIISNPPYIASAVIETLTPEVKDFDPRLALDGGSDGSEPYRIIARQAGAFLKPGGQLLVEIGYDQGQAVSALFAAAGFASIVIHRDLSGLDRVVLAHQIEATNS